MARRDARSSPRLTSIALAPAAMFFMPSATIACARIVGGGGPVTGGAAQQLRAIRIFQRERLGDGHAIVADDRHAQFCSIRTHFDRDPSVTRTALR